ncbi:MAG: type IV pili methyl-accepting chemotaxis transducer N-terminal domain-containing protein, partial [Bdellovibrionales bacterium]|nr:PAS domain-containing protein [Bdellovibrionales bacterium]NQZ17931.1 type IV pili methyl-accepting chemotaxis transducer N-terminal domain-containing protein [Bdellovibrionales bacterium]
MIKSEALNIKKKYIGVALVLFATTFIGIISTQVYLSQQEDKSTVVNFAGRQRMLSQKITKNVLLLDMIQDDQKQLILDALKSDIAAIKKRNSDLLNGNEVDGILPAFTKQIAGLYREQVLIINDLETSVNCVVEKCSNHKIEKMNVVKNSSKFLAKMEEIVHLSANNSKNSIKNLIIAETLLLLFMTILISYKFIRIIIPINNKLLGQIDELQKKDEFSSIIEKTARIGCWELDIHSGMTTWSDEVYNIHKVPVGTETHKVNAIEFYAPHDRPRITKYVEECISEKKPYDDEFEFYDNEGTHKWVRDIGTPVLDGKDNV